MKELLSHVQRSLCGWHVVICLQCPLQKSLRESGLDNGRYRVFFTTDKSRHSEASIRITPSSFDECFMDYAEKRDYSVKVSLHDSKVQVTL